MLPALALLAVDLLRRGRDITHFDRLHTLGYFATVLLSGVLWAIPLVGAACRRGVVRHVFTAIVVVAYTWVFALSQGFRTRWNIYPGRDTLENIESIGFALRSGLSAQTLLLHGALGALVAWFAVRSARRVSRIRRRFAYPAAILLMPCVIFGVIKTPVSYREIQSTSSDLLLINGFVERHANLENQRRPISILPREMAALPVLKASPARPRNVLFILKESERADAVCIDHQESCTRANRETNKAMPDRIPFFQAHSNDSATTISMWVLFSGMSPTASRSEIKQAPFMWDYASRAGYETAYFGSQNLIYGNLYLLVNEFPGRLQIGTNILSEANFWYGAPDALLADRVISELSTMKEPFFTVVHSCNVHTPRLVDPAASPFPPSPHEPKNRDTSRSYYLNSVYLSDLAMARVVNSLRSTEAGRRTVIVYTSDHGESFGEHGSVPVHGYTQYEEEIHVPLFIDAPPGTLSEEEHTNLTAKRDAFVFHLDVAATLLDLLGLWNEPGIAGQQKKMLGHPLTRAPLTTSPVPVSNIAWLWERNPSWGMMAGHRKLAGPLSSAQWSCFDVLTDPEEHSPLSSDKCADLELLANKLYGGPPRSFHGLRQTPSWGEPDKP